MLTVDGVMADGSVIDSCVSTYPLDCYTCLRDCAPIGLLQLDDDDPVASRARAYLEALVAALPCASLTTCFHCELFDSASRGMMLCEIASRTGGGRIQDMFRHSRGVDLTQWAALGQAGVDPVGVIAPPARSRMLTAFALFPSPGGVLIDAPKAPAPSAVIDYHVYTRCGDYMPRWKRVSEYAVDALIGADTRGALELAYRDTLEWVESGLVWARDAV